MTVDERLDKLTGIVETLANTVVAHDNQIEALLKIAERHELQIEALFQMAERNEKTWQDLQRQWQAYLNTLPKQ